MFSRIKAVLLAAALLAGGGLLSTVSSASEYHTTFLGNLAAGGYDPVAYFTMDKAITGKRAFTLKWKGANWRFVSQQHLDMFKADPEKYAPRYGGHCAWAVAEKDMLYRGSPQHWDIVDGKLYLNHNGTINERWRKNPEGHVQKANEHWVDLKK